MKKKEKGKEVMEGGKNQPPLKTEHQRAGKQSRTMQMRSTTEGDKKANHQAAAPVWALRMEVDGAPLLEDASIRDFQWGTSRYVANEVEQSLLLPKDMANLRSMRQYEVFLGLKRDLAMVNLFFIFCIIFFF